MNRLLTIAAASALLSVTLTSCIKEEALNAECDITGVDAAWLTEHKSLLLGEPIVGNTHVAFSIQKGSDRSALDPRFELTPGARLVTSAGGTTADANGTVRDFSTPQTYTAISEDGNWTKDYTVSFSYPRPIGTCSFEHYELDKTGRYQVWYEVDPTDADNPRRDYWSTGNAGFALTGMAHAPADYPTAIEPLGVKGNCVKLVTRDTGSFGNTVKMPIAAGNLFIGEFRVNQAMLSPRRATRFGLQLVGGRPLRFEGYYKYKAGTVFTDSKKQVHPELHDTADIYAVLYEVNPDGFVALNGDDVLSSPRIVAMARIDKPGEPEEWTRFSEEFRPMNGKEFDEQRLRTDGYAIAVVATSSRQGAYFEGAVGSTLYVDELRIVWDGEQPE